MKKVMALLFAVLFLACDANSSFAAEKTVRLKFSHAGPRTSTWHDGAEKFVSIVREKTGGKFEIVIFPSDELSGGNQVAGIELVQSGTKGYWSAVINRHCSEKSEASFLF
jgi:TRAP-type C4-dicarboxylate transport system substrate-binding protein